MSGGVAVNMDRRRTSIGVDERALTTLEKFVELCENGLEEEDEENEDSVASSLTHTGASSHTGTLEVGAVGGVVKKCPSTGDATKEKEKSRKEKIYSRLNSLSWNYRPKKSEAHKVKLSELFIDPSLVAIKTKPEYSSQGEGIDANGSSGDVGSASGSKSGTKKSEEIWVKRANDPGRRSFRITNLRGQELPSILTEDVDEETAGNSYPTHYHTVTGATPGIQQMLKPILLAKTEKHRSGDDINLAGKKKTSLMDVFRPRSKSDASKLKKPNFMSKMQNSLMGGSSESQSQNASSSSAHRPRSGSESTKSPVSKVMDIFRTRSHSVTTSDDKRKKHGSSNSWTPQEKGVHASRISTMPHKSVGTGSISPVSNMIAYSASNYCSSRRDSGGSNGSDRRGSGSSSCANRDGRRDSGGSSYSSSRGRKDSGDSTTTTATSKLIDESGRERRDSGSSDKSDESKKKRGIFRQLIKWSSPGHRFKSKKEKESAKEKTAKKEHDAKEPVGANRKEETKDQEETQFKMSTEFNRDRVDSPSPLTSPNKRSDSRASTLTDVTDSRSDSECSSCSVSGSGSEDEEDEVKKLAEDYFACGARSIGRGHHDYRSYYPYYHGNPRRVRSQSLDYVHARKENRRRRFSENNEWVRNEKKKEVAQEEEEDEPKAYTIYQSILKEMGRRGSLHSHRPADALIDPAHAAILFRDSRGLPVADPFLERILTLSEEDQTEILVKFFKFHKCYDLIPTSAKLVVFDTQLLVKKAFFALVYNGVRAAPLWDSSVRQFVGMLTITDFIRVLHAMYHDSAGRMSELEEHRIETWRRRFLQDKQPIIFIDPDASLFDAICTLVNNRIHRLPIIDQQGNVLHILTHKRILKFLFLYVHEIPRPVFLNQKLGDVRIGTFEGVETAKEDTSIIQALQKFLDRRVSALPIVDEQNRLLDIYARFDVINLAAEKTYNNLDITLKQANEHRNEWFEGVHKCTLDETLFVIMERIVKAEVHRLVVVDEQDRVVGVLSLSDILQYLVMRPEVKDIKALDLKELMSRAESPRPEVITPTTPQPDPLMPSDDDDPSAQEEEETNQTEANNNRLSPSDLNGSRDNPTIIEEEDEKA